jgi:UDP-N-acetylmuramyl pentapeptide phosphotransferase/UDP-N-acetylglucosamine-1-phosphate transferase
MLFLAVIISFFVTVLLTPVAIKFLRSIDLMDAPEKRKVHLHNTPSMGGVAIFMGIVTASLFCIPFQELAINKFVLLGIFLSFLLGLRDDVSSLQAKQKLIIQSLAAFIVVFYGDIRIDSFFGIFGIHEIPIFVSAPLTVFVIVGLANAYNLIDGIDGLAGSVSLIASLFFGFWFFHTGNTFFMVVSMGLASSLAAFLLFNWNPSRIFMGDTGSILIGFLLATSAIVFINENATYINTPFFHFEAFVAMAVSVLIVPVYDTFRVFTMRIFEGKSPFVPDKKHIHHILLKQGFSHGQATLILIALNLFSIAAVMSMQGLGNLLLILFLSFSSIAFGLFFDLRFLRFMRSARRKARSSTNSSVILTKSA